MYAHDRVCLCFMPSLVCTDVHLVIWTRPFLRPLMLLFILGFVFAPTFSSPPPLFGLLASFLPFTVDPFVHKRSPKNVYYTAICITPLLLSYSARRIHPSGTLSLCVCLVSRLHISTILPQLAPYSTNKLVFTCSCVVLSVSLLPTISSMLRCNVTQTRLQLP